MKSLQESLLDISGVEKNMGDVFRLMLETIMSCKGRDVRDAADALYNWAIANGTTDSSKCHSGTKPGVYVISSRITGFADITEIIYFAGGHQYSIRAKVGTNNMAEVWTSTYFCSHVPKPKNRNNIRIYLGDNEEYRNAIWDITREEKKNKS